MKTPAFGDRVRVLPTPATIQVGLANKVGIVYGVTTPSCTGVQVLGPATADVAFHVHIDGDERELWLPNDALEFLDHSPGLTATIGKTTLIRGRNGQWRRTKPGR